MGAAVALALSQPIASWFLIFSGMALGLSAPFLLLAYMPVLGRFGLVGSDGHKAASAIQEAIREPKISIAISNAARDGNPGTRLFCRNGLLKPGTVVRALSQLNL